RTRRGARRTRQARRHARAVVPRSSVRSPLALTQRRKALGPIEDDAPAEVSTIRSTESPSQSSPSRPPWLTTTLASVTEKAAYRFVASHARRTVTELSDPTDGGSSTIAGAPVHSPSAPSVATAACIGASNTGRGGAPLLSC